MPEFETSKVARVHYTDEWLRKLPGSPGVKMFVASALILGTSGYFFFRDAPKSGKDKGQGGLLDSERPEAVFRAMDESEKKKISRGLSGAQPQEPQLKGK